MPSSPRNPVVPASALWTFVLLTCCFAAWGVANNMTDPLVKVFSRIFTMSAFESSLVQFSFYGAYFCLALPAAVLLKKTSYKTGVLVGLGIFICGAMLFYPAGISMQYGYFLAAIFVLAGGLSILETSCNPFIVALGSEETATRRLNLAQAFNPVGSVAGTMLAGFFILPGIRPLNDAERAALAPEQLAEIRSSELAAVMGPYLGMAAVLVLLWVAIAVKKMPSDGERSAERVDFLPTFRRLLRTPGYVFGVVAQFFYVAAQICVWTFTIHYIAGVVESRPEAGVREFLESSGVSAMLMSIRLVGAADTLSPETVAGIYHICALLLFLGFRFVCTFLMRLISPSVLLLFMAVIAAVCTVVSMSAFNFAGVVALLAISACMSLMFPTIYGIALRGLGTDLKIGGAGLVMAILGGALLPLVQALLIDRFSVAFSFVVPLVCFVVVAGFAFFDLRRGDSSPTAAGQN